MPTVLATQEPTTQSLPRANTRAPGSFPSDQYVHIPGLPVFREHRTKDNDGHPLIFNAAALDKLAKQCNRRIQESGDYAAIIVGHTSSKDDPVQRFPEVIGYAGPFHLGVMGQNGPRPVYCILADFWIRRDKLDIYHAHPRRSAELWVQGGQSFLDPIALLGGDPPRLDLGLAPEIGAKGSDGANLSDNQGYGPRFFYAMRDNRQVLKYSMAAMSAGPVSASPSDSNVSPRSAKVMGKRKPGGTTGTSQSRVIKMAAAHSQPNEGKAMPTPITPPESDQQAGTAAAGAGHLSPEDLKQIIDALMQTEPMQYLRRKMEEEHGQEGIGDEIGTGEGNTEGEDALAGEIPPEDNAVSPAPEGGQLPPQGELPGDITPHQEPDGDESGDEELNGLKHKYGANFGEFEESAKRYAACCAKKKKYEAAGSAEQSGKNPLPAGSGSVEETVGPSDNGSTGGESQGGVGQTGAKGGAVKYSALESRLRELEADRGKRVDQERKAILQQLSYHRIFDFDKEFERVKYSKKNALSDEAFKEHCDMIVENYQPLGASSMPFPAEMVDSAPLPGNARPAGAPVQYSRKTCEQAVQYCLKKREEGKEVDYGHVLEKIEKGQPLD